jgi:ubiquinone/menaquinone biosynthesis C-methylase UbiE
MKDAKEKVYDNLYANKATSYEVSQGLIAFLYNKLLRFQSSRYQAAYDLLPFDQGKLLDVGCGDGDFIFIAKDKFKEIHGVDISSTRIERAGEMLNERSCSNIHFHQCDLDEGLPFSNSFFDVVSCIAVLEHVLNPPRMIEEIRRVLNRGGILIVQVPNIAWIPYRIQLLFGGLPKTGGVYLEADWEHLHIFNKETLCRLLLKEGFQIKDVTCSGVFAKYRKWWPSALGADLVLKSAKI